MIEVEGPDGAIIEFPDGTPQGVMQTALIKHYQAQARAAKPIDNAAKAGVAGALRGATFGFLDEGAAGVEAALNPVFGSGQAGETFGQRYDRNLSQVRADLKAGETDYPKSTLAGEVVGGVAGALPLGIPKTIRAATGIGLLTGGAHGFGTGEGGAVPRLESARDASVWGAGLGAVALPAGRLVGKGVEGIMGAFKPGIPEAGRASAKALEEGLGNDRIAPDMLSQRLGDLGPEGMFADLGPNTRGLATGLANTQGEARPVVVDALTKRAEGAGQRIEQTLSDTVGPRVNEVEKLKELVAGRKANAASLYGAAEANARPVDVSAVLKRIDDEMAPGVTAMIGSGVEPDATAKALMAARRRIAGDSSQAFDLKTLHTAQDVIDDMASEAAQAGRGKEAAVLRDVRRELLKSIETTNPNYRAARQTYAGDRAIEEAFQNGQRLFATSERGVPVTPNVIAERTANLTPGESEAFQLGTRVAIQNQMGFARNDAGKVRGLFQSDFNAEKLGLGAGPRNAETVLKRVTAEDEMSKTAYEALQNSQTAAKQTGKEAVKVRGSGSNGTMEISGAAGGASGLATAAVLRALGAAKSGLLKGADETRNVELGKLLTMMEGPERAAVVEALMARSSLKGTAGKIGSRADAAVRGLLATQGHRAEDVPLPAGLLGYGNRGYGLLAR